MKKDEEAFNAKAHATLLKELKELDGKSKLKRIGRKKVVRVSTDFAPTFNTQLALKKIGDEKLSASAGRLKSLIKPLEKPAAKRIKRAAAYEKVAVESNKWAGVVNQRRNADQLVFPLNQPAASVVDSIKKSKPSLKTPLEQEVYSLLNGAKLIEDEKETEEEEIIRRAMTLKEIKLKSREDWRRKILKIRLERKAALINKSKSRKYHRILRRERFRKKKEEFERLREKDPEAALEILEELEKARVQERMSLRHKNSRWLTTQRTRLGQDHSAQSGLHESAEMRKELLEKMKPPEEENDSEYNDILQKQEEWIRSGNLDPANQWVSHLALPTKEEKEDASFYKTKMFWEEYYNRKIEELKAQKEAEKKKEEGGKERLIRSIDEAVDKDVGGVYREEMEKKQTEAEEQTCSEEKESEEFNDKVKTKLNKEGTIKVNKVDNKKGAFKKIKKKENVIKEKQTKTSEKSLKMKEINTASKNKKAEVTEEENKTEVQARNYKLVIKKKAHEREKGISKRKVEKRNSTKRKKFKGRQEQTEKQAPDKRENCEVEANNQETAVQSTSKQANKISKKTKKRKLGPDKTDKQEPSKPVDTKNANKPVKMNKQKKKRKLGDDLTDLVFIDDVFDRGEKKMAEKMEQKLSKGEAKLKKIEDNLKSKKMARTKMKDKSSDLTEMEFDFTAKDLPANEETLSRLRTTEDCDKLSMEKGSGKEILTEKDFIHLEKENVPEKEAPAAVNLQEGDVTKIKSRRLGSALPDLKFLSEMKEDSDFEVEEDLQGLFDDDENIEAFKKEKKAQEEADTPKDINLQQQGWGHWGGPGIVHKQKERTLKAPRRPPRHRYSTVGNVIYSEKNDVHQNIRKLMVSELPAPFRTVADFEASIRQPIGRTFVPEAAHKSLIAPPVVTKMGAVIEPMGEEALLKYHESTKQKSKLEKRLDKHLSNNSRKRSALKKKKADRKPKIIKTFKIHT